MQFFYNGVVFRLPYTLTPEFSERDVWLGKNYSHTDFNVTVRGYIPARMIAVQNPALIGGVRPVAPIIEARENDSFDPVTRKTNQAGGGRPVEPFPLENRQRLSLADRVVELRNKLGEARGDLVFADHDGDLEQILANTPIATYAHDNDQGILISAKRKGDFADVMGGPFPQIRSIVDIKGGGMMWIDFRFKFSVRLCEFSSLSDAFTVGRILQHSWSTELRIDQNHGVTRITNGTVQIDASQGVNPLDIPIRRLVIPSEISGFQRTEVSWADDPEESKLFYRITDRQYYLPPPAGMTTARGSYSESTQDGITTIAQVNVSCEAPIPKADINVEFGDENVALRRAKGRAQLFSKAQVFEAAVRVALSYVSKAGKDIDEGILLQGAASTDIWSNTVTVSLTILLADVKVHRIISVSNSKIATIPNLAGIPGQRRVRNAQSAVREDLPEPPSPGVGGSWPFVPASVQMQQHCTVAGLLNEKSLSDEQDKSPGSTGRHAVFQDTIKLTSTAPSSSEHQNFPYTHVDQVSEYVVDDHTFHFPVVNDSTRTSVSIQAAPQTVQRIVKFDNERIGTQPAIPQLLAVNGETRLGSIVKLPGVGLTGGLQEVHRQAGRHVFALDSPPDNDKFALPNNPAQATMLANKTLDKSNQKIV